MKKLMLLAVAAITVLSMSAQSFEDFFSSEKSKDKVTFGFRVGLNINGMRNNIHDNDISKIFSDRPYTLDVHKKAGLNFGVSIDIPVLKSLWINTGVYYSASGAKFTFRQDNSKVVEGTFLDDYTANVTMHNVRIPVQASYRYNINKNYELQVNLGPYFAYGIGGKAYIHNDVKKEKLGAIDLTGNPEFDYVIYELFDENVSTLNPDLADRDEVKILGTANINDKNTNYINPFDMGIAFGVGVTFNHKYFAGFNYDGGLVNVNGKRLRALNHNNIKNHTFSINVGYNF
ncbi:MAG: PorT family protein [Muribaculaceae bacterium]|nr:PorT family protein [Muribaculaceae bacterium]MBR5118118.1 PorT family protein [Muribaculaceae bacterium]